MSVNIGQLVFELAANVGRLEKDMGKAAAVITKAHRQITSAAKWIGVSLAGAFSVRAITTWVDTATEAMARWHSLSQSLGMTSESLSGMAYAARLADVPLEDLSQGIRQLTKNVLGTGGPTKDAQEALQSLGLSAKAATTAEGWLNVLADRFSELPDGATKSAAALGLFGKSGTQMVPFLNQGSKAIAELSDEAERLGLRIGSAAAAEAEAFRDEIDRLKASFEGLGTSIAREAIPGLKTFFETWNEGIRNGKEFQGLALALGTAFSDRMAMEADQTIKGRLDLVEKQAQEAAERIRRGAEQQASGGLYGSLAKFLGQRGLKEAVAEHERLVILARELERLYQEQLAAAEAKRQAIVRQGQEQRRLAEQEAQDEAARKDRLEELNQVLREAKAEYEAQARAEKEAAKQAAEIREWAARSELEAHREHLKRLADMDEQAQEERLRLAEQLADRQRQAYQKMVDASRDASRQASSAFADLAFRGQWSFSKMVDSMIEDLFRLAVQRSFLNDLMGGLFGALGGNKPVPSTSITASGSGSATAHSGSATAMASGGIFTQPTMVAGGAGIAGEAGLEAALPLTRTRSGDLGVQATGAGVTVQVFDQRGRGAQVEVEQGQGDGGGQLIKVMIRDEVRGGLMDGSYDSAMRQSYGLRRGSVRR